MSAKELTREDRTAILSEIAGNVCRCGATKTYRQMFCVKCFYSLPSVNRGRLYAPFGEGYEAAYLDSLEILAEIAKGGE